MPDRPPGREDGNAEHDGGFHQFSRPHAKSRDCPKRADGAEHESGREHEGEIEHASLEGFLHGRASQRQSTINSFTAYRVPNIALLFWASQPGSQMSKLAARSSV